MFRRRDLSGSKQRSRERSSSAPGVQSKRKGSSTTYISAVRSSSLPLPSARPRTIKGIMKYSTEDESIHSAYGRRDGKEDRDKRIEFKDILIREFARTVGDNPSCSSGPPISIAWEYNPDTKVISLDQYEETRPERRTHFEMVLPRDVRQQMLKKEWDVSQSQIAAAVRNNIRVKGQRRATVNNLGKATKMEERLEKTGKFVKGLFGKNDKKELEKLQKQMERYNSVHQSTKAVRNDHEYEESILDEEASPTEDVEGEYNDKESEEKHGESVEF